MATTSSPPRSNTRTRVSSSARAVSTITGVCGSISPAGPGAAPHGVEQTERLAVEVGEHQLRPVRGEEVQRVPAAAGEQDLVAVGCELIGEERAGALVLLDDQDQVRTHVSLLPLE